MIMSAGLWAAFWSAAKAMAAACLFAAPLMAQFDYSTWQKNDISPSRLKMWMDCPRKYFYNYVQHLPKPGRDFFISGNVFDEIAMEMFREDPSQDVEPIVDLAGNVMRERLDHNSEWYKKNLIRGREATFDDLKKLNGEPMSLEEREKAVLDFRTWTRGFLTAWQNGEDFLGNKLSMLPIADTQVECIWPIQIEGRTVRIHGYADILHEDGSVTDLKMASDWHTSIWTSGRIMSEMQWVPYSQALNTNDFRYIVTHKHKTGYKDKRKAGQPTVETFEVTVYPSDVERFKDLVTQFVRSTDFLNGHENGVFPAVPEYGGNALGWGGAPRKNICKNKTEAGKACKHENSTTALNCTVCSGPLDNFNEYQLPQVNFCRKLCDFKDTCFKECFGGSFREAPDPRDGE